MLTYTSLPSTPQPIPKSSPQRCGIPTRPPSSNINYHLHLNFHHRLTRADKFDSLESPLFLTNPNDSLRTKLGRHLELFTSHTSLIALCLFWALQSSYYLRKHRVLRGFIFRQFRSAWMKTLAPCYGYLGSGSPVIIQNWQNDVSLHLPIPSFISPIHQCYPCSAGHGHIHRFGQCTSSGHLGCIDVRLQIGWRIRLSVFIPKWCFSCWVTNTQSAPPINTVVVNNPLVP